MREYMKMICLATVATAGGRDKREGLKQNKKVYGSRNKNAKHSETLSRQLACHGAVGITVRVISE